jgi:hypothetical protein
MFIQPDGKVVCGGSFSTYNNITKSKLVRLETDGQIDTTFNVGTGPNSSVNTVALHPTGKIIVGGAFVTYNAIASRRLAVINTDGSIDATFAIGTGFTGTGSVAALHCAADGKVMVGGLYTGFNGTSAGNIVRLNNTNPLPVTLTSFTAQHQNNSALLNWATASEINNKGFEIERSKDKHTWQAIGFVKGNGTTQFGSKYDYVDLDFNGAITYYRLKQTDFNGAFSYSSTVVVANNEKGSIPAGPNPFTTELNLGTASDVVLYDINGNVVVEAKAATTIATGHLQPGLYTLKKTTPEGPVFQKLIRQ